MKEINDLIFDLCVNMWGATLKLRGRVEPDMDALWAEFQQKFDAHENRATPLVRHFASELMRACDEHELRQGLGEVVKS